MAPSRSSGADTFEMPTEEPALAGFTNTGYPRPATRLRTSSGSLSHCADVTTVHGPVGRPAPASIAFMWPLSMAADEAKTPDPTYGVPAISSRPWRVPSSPQGPCRTGNTTSMSRIAPDVATAPMGSGTNTTDSPVSITVGSSPAAVDVMASGFAGTRTHRPSGSTPTAITS